MNVIDRTISFLANKRGIFTGPKSEYVPSFRGQLDAPNVNHNTALTFTGAFSAISTKAETLASLPKQIFQTTSKGKVLSTKHPVYRLIHFQPNPIMTDFAFWEKIEADVAGWGNSIVVIDFDGNGYPRALWPIEPDNFQILREKKQITYKILNGDFAGIYNPGDILHPEY